MIKVKFFKINEYIKKILKKIIFYKYKKKIIIKGDSKVAIAYNEGIDLNKRSDLFWLKESNVNPKDIILYFELKI